MGENSALITRIEEEVRSLFSGEGTGHDWFHINRVRNMALEIARNEEADLEVIELAAFLHDIADHKFHDNNLSVGPNRATAVLLDAGCDPGLAERIAQIVAEVSFKGAGVKTTASSVEAAVVQDADRLDALGAIGIARAFAYGGSKNRELYNPAVKPVLHTDFKAYAKSEGTTVNHFYEKLFLLKDRMQTRTGMKIAEERHRFMENFLNTFYSEWGE